MLGFHRRLFKASAVCAVLVAFTLSIATLTPSTTYVKTLRVPQKYPTIQAAINSADPGDKISIKGGMSYDECITIHKNNLKLVGQKKRKKKRPTIFSYNCGGPSITIRTGVTGVKITGLNLYLSQQEGILCKGNNNGTSIQHCAVFSALDVGMRLRGNGISVTSCEVQFSRLSGIVLEGNSNKITNCRSIGSDAHGIELTGSGNLISKSRFLRNNKSGMVLSGNDNDVSGNLVTANSGDGIIFTGSNGNRVDGNEVRSNGGVAIKFPADSNFNEVVRNKLRSCPDYGILIVSGEYNSIDRNVIKSFANDAIRISGANKSIRRNKIQSISNGKGISVEGDTNRIEDNEVLDCSDTGISFAGNDSTIVGNTVQSCITDGANAIAIGGNNNFIGSNVCSEVSSYVMDVRGNLNSLSNNYTALSFNASGIHVIGNRNVIGKDPEEPFSRTFGNASEDNNMDGISVLGNKNLISGNTSINNGHFGEHGIDLDGNDNTVINNESIGNSGDGINVFGDSNEIVTNTVTENGIDGIDIQGDNGDRSKGDTEHGNNLIDGNFAQFNGAEGIENNALSGAGGGGGTLIVNNTSQFNRSWDFAVSRRKPDDPVSDAVAPGSLNNVSRDGSHEFDKAPVADSW